MSFKLAQQLNFTITQMMQKPLEKGPSREPLQLPKRVYPLGHPNYLSNYQYTLKELQSGASSNPELLKEYETVRNYMQDNQQQLSAVVGQVTNELEQKLLDQGLHISNGPDALVWDRRHQCLLYRAHIADKADNPLNGHLTSREIQVRIMLEGSHVAQDKLDLFERLNSLHDTAMYVQSNTSIPPGEKRGLLAATQKLEAVRISYLHKLDDLFDQNDSSGKLSSAITLQQIKSANAILQSAHFEFLSVLQRTYPGRIENHALQKAEPELVSILKRPLMVQIAKSIAANPMESADLWFTNVHTPLSDVPSPSRTGKFDILPNWYESETKIYRTEGRDINLISEHNLGRSSSVPPIKIKNPAERLRKARTIARNFVLRHVASDVQNYLKDKGSLNDGDLQHIAALLKPKLSFVTLLSPVTSPLRGSVNEPTLGVVPQSLWARLKQGLWKIAISFATPGAQNEYLQLQETRSAFENNKPTASPSEVAKWLESFPPAIARNKKLIQLMTQTPVEPEMLFQNYGVNDARGFDQTGVESHINEKFIQTLLHNVRVRLADGAPNPKAGEDADESLRPHMDSLQKKIQDVRMQLGFISTIKPEPTRDLAYYTPTNFHYLQEQYTLALMAQHLVTLNGSTAEDDPNNPQNPKNNYLRPVLASLLSRKLGYATHTTCKSGEDRTGAFEVMVNTVMMAFSSMPLSELSDLEKLKQRVWSDYTRQADISASHWVTDRNAPGARGLQSLAGTGGSRHIRDRLKAVLRPLFPAQRIMDAFKISNQMAKTAKAPYKRSLKMSLQSLLGMGRAETSKDEQPLQAQTEPLSSDKTNHHELEIEFDKNKGSEPEFIKDEYDNQYGKQDPSDHGQKFETNRAIQKEGQASQQSFHQYDANSPMKVSCTKTNRALKELSQNVIKSLHGKISGLYFDDERNCFTVNKVPALEVQQNGVQLSMSIIPSSEDTKFKKESIEVLAQAIIASQDMHPRIDSGTLKDMKSLQDILIKHNPNIKLQLGAKLQERYPEWTAKSDNNVPQVGLRSPGKNS